MTAHATKPTITPERIQWFADYYRANPAWGVFHVCLYDANWKIGSSTGTLDNPRGKWPEDLLEAADWFDTLTPSQRRRLALKAEDLVNTVVRSVRAVAS